MAKYQDSVINKKNKVKSGMKHPAQFRLNKMLKTGLDKYDWLLLPDKNGNLKMIQVQIVDKEACEKDTQNVVKKYVSPLEMIGLKLDTTDVKNIEDIYYIIKDAHIELEFGQYIYPFMHKFYKSMYDVFVARCRTPNKTIIIDGETVYLGYDQYEYQIVDRCLYRGEMIPKFITGIDEQDLWDFPESITAMPQKKYCIGCDEPFITTNNSQKYCASCGYEIQRENTEAWLEHKREQGWNWDYRLQKYVTWTRKPKALKYRSTRVYIEMKRSGNSDQN